MKLIKKILRRIYNPYRIPNGIRPQFKKTKHNLSAADLERCHELIVQKRQQGKHEK